MTPEQIKTLIDQKIAGQGSMVDIGGALPEILNAIVDNVERANQPAIDFHSPFRLDFSVPFMDNTIAQAAPQIGVSVDNLTRLVDKNVPYVKIAGDLYRVTYNDKSESITEFYFVTANDSTNYQQYGWNITFNRENQTVSAGEY